MIFGNFITTNSPNSPPISWRTMNVNPIMPVRNRWNMFACRCIRCVAAGICELLSGCTHLYIVMRMHHDEPDRPTELCHRIIFVRCFLCICITEYIIIRPEPKVLQFCVNTFTRHAAFAYTNTPPEPMHQNWIVSTWTTHLLAYHIVKLNAHIHIQPHWQLSCTFPDNLGDWVRSLGGNFVVQLKPTQRPTANIPERRSWFFVCVLVLQWCLHFRTIPYRRERSKLADVNSLANTFATRVRSSDALVRSMYARNAH